MNLTDTGKFKKQRTTARNQLKSAIRKLAAQYDLSEYAVAHAICDSVLHTYDTAYGVDKTIPNGLAETYLPYVQEGHTKMTKAAGLDSILHEAPPSAQYVTGLKKYPAWKQAIKDSYYQSLETPHKNAEMVYTGPDTGLYATFEYAGGQKYQVLNVTYQHATKDIKVIKTGSGFMEHGSIKIQIEGNEIAHLGFKNKSAFLDWIVNQQYTMDACLVPNLDSVLVWYKVNQWWKHHVGF